MRTKTCGITEFYPFAWTESDDGRISALLQSSFEVFGDFILIYSHFGTFRQSTATGQNGQGRNVTGRNDTQRNARAKCYRRNDTQRNVRAKCYRRNDTQRNVRAKCYRRNDTERNVRAK